MHHSKLKLSRLWAALGFGALLLLTIFLANQGWPPIALTVAIVGVTAWLLGRKKQTETGPWKTAARFL